MYKSPIDVIYQDIVRKFENGIMNAVQKCDINVDKDELVRALQYDREQYEKGYADGKMHTEWIPCSERLPKDEKNKYWICTDNGYQMECRWTNANHFWTNLTTEWHWNLFDIPQYSKVIAWMPLPEPYKGEEDG